MRIALDIARGVRRDCIGAHAIMRSYLLARVGASGKKAFSFLGENACEREPARDSRWRPVVIKGTKGKGNRRFRSLPR